MNRLPKTDIVIFDCDGVIFDSNSLKIQAMRESLELLKFDKALVDDCCDFFSSNFGKSRYFHVRHFVENLLPLEQHKYEGYYEKILNEYAKRCKILYLEASLTPGIENFLISLDAKCYIASGSDECELKGVFKARDLSPYFSGVFGSPNAKTQIVRRIIEENKGATCLMIGDASSDLSAALDNGIDFCAYVPFSNVRDSLIKETQLQGFAFVDSWDELSFIE
jgi:phosphoglycolate phosphatase-like HAD superfamily hydrolase